jgi:hypothetical protein
MPPSLAIGDFSRATHLNIKTLRHYHRIGLLEPAYVDPDTGHRRYGTDQIPAAHNTRASEGDDGVKHHTSMSNRSEVRSPRTAIDTENI